VSEDADLVEAVVELGAKTVDNPLGGVGMFSLVVRPVAPPVEEVLEAARAAAAGADVAIVVVGLTEEQETEAVDKATIALPGEQDALVRAVAAAARRTVVVVNAATPVLMPWAGEVDAILVAGLTGQEGGHAVAAALLGVIEPAGRLVTTFPAADGAAPAWEVVPTDGDLRYEEGTFIGYRGHYAQQAPAPAFWLGEGLGYSTWDYTEAELLPGPASPTVRVRLTNTGERDSREVVQVYYEPQADSQPIRLVGWATAQVATGASTTVDVSTDARLWRRWDSHASSWGEPLTGGRLLVARGLGDIRADLPL
jgi:beta-glucosidase